MCNPSSILLDACHRVVNDTLRCVVRIADDDALAGCDGHDRDYEESSQKGDENEAHVQFVHMCVEKRVVPLYLAVGQGD